MMRSTLTVYLSGRNSRTDRAITKLQAVCARISKPPIDLAVVDLSTRPLEEFERVLPIARIARHLPATLLEPLRELQTCGLFGVDHVVTQLPPDPIRKVPTDIAGFDLIADGGLPYGRTTMVSGTAGACKTIFAAQFLVEGIVRHDEPGVFITFEERPADIRRNVASFGWSIERWETEGRWAFVDASPQPSLDATIIGDFDFTALVARVGDAIRRIGATRAALDSIGSIFTHFPDTARVRYELYRVISALRDLKVTSIMTAERVEEFGPISRSCIEEFAADSVIILRNVLEGERRRRTVEILKMRGATHHNGEYTFSVVPKSGLFVLPFTDQFGETASLLRVSSGIPKLDQMCGGGFLRDSVVLVSGASGTGKTLLIAHFINGASSSDERTLMFCYEESRAQLARNALGWGIDFDALEKEGQLRTICHPPKSTNLEDELVRLIREVDTFAPTRLVLDSITALQRVASERSLYEFLLAVTSLCKERGITGLLSATAPVVIGFQTPTVSNISELSDTVILLHHIEIGGDLRHGISVLKMRGSVHERQVREFSIDATGMHIGKSLKRLSGVIAGTPVPIPSAFPSLTAIAE